MFPDFFFGTINKKPIIEVIKEEDWFTNSYFPTVCKRGR